MTHNKLPDLVTTDATNLAVGIDYANVKDDVIITFVVLGMKHGQMIVVQDEEIRLSETITEYDRHKRIAEWCQTLAVHFKAVVLTATQVKPDPKLATIEKFKSVYSPYCIKYINEEQDNSTSNTQPGL